MALRHICDRCGGDLENASMQRGLIARLRRGIEPRWKFWDVSPLRYGFHDLYELNKNELDLCQKCTKAFFALVRSKP